MATTSNHSRYPLTPSLWPPSLPPTPLRPQVQRSPVPVENLRGVQEPPTPYIPNSMVAHNVALIPQPVQVPPVGHFLTYPGGLPPTPLNPQAQRPAVENLRGVQEIPVPHSMVPQVGHYPVYLPQRATQTFSSFVPPVVHTSKESGSGAMIKVTKSGPDILYNAGFLYLPWFYRSRVYQVLRCVSLTENEIITLYTSATPQDAVTLKYWAEVKQSWNEFIDSILSEWRTLNIVSALLLTAIYNVLQLGAYRSSLTQCAAFMSLISALMSLIFGCLYLIRFETMRRPYKAMQWASDALNSSRSVLWNVYILLALPSIWLAWSLILFVVCLMSIVWQRAGHTVGNTGFIPLSVQVAVSAQLFIGMVHLSMVLATFARYGTTFDKTWSKRLSTFISPTQPDFTHQSGYNVHLQTVPPVLEGPRVVPFVPPPSAPPIVSSHFPPIVPSIESSTDISTTPPNQPPPFIAPTPPLWGQSGTPQWGTPMLWGSSGTSWGQTTPQWASAITPISSALPNLHHIPHFEPGFPGARNEPREQEPAQVLRQSTVLPSLFVPQSHDTRYTSEGSPQRASVPEQRQQGSTNIQATPDTPYLGHVSIPGSQELDSHVPPTSMQERQEQRPDVDHGYSTGQRPDTYTQYNVRYTPTNRPAAPTYEVAPVPPGFQYPDPLGGVLRDLYGRIAQDVVDRQDEIRGVSARLDRIMTTMTSQARSLDSVPVESPSDPAEHPSSSETPGTQAAAGHRPHTVRFAKEIDEIDGGKHNVNSKDDE